MLLTMLMAMMPYVESNVYPTGIMMIDTQSGIVEFGKKSEIFEIGSLGGLGSSKLGDNTAVLLL